MSRTFGDPPHYYEVRIDGEDWIVRQGAKPGSYRFNWASGGDRGSGFSSQSSDGSALTTAEMDQDIREFLADLDPETGHVRA